MNMWSEMFENFKRYLDELIEVWKKVWVEVEMLDEEVRKVREDNGYLEN